jgi:hypothetical protein
MPFHYRCKETANQCEGRGRVEEPSCAASCRLGEDSANMKQCCYRTGVEF